MFKLDGDVLDRDQIEIVDADGNQQSGWSVFEVWRLASTFNNQGSLEPVKKPATEVAVSGRR